MLNIMWLSCIPAIEELTFLLIEGGRKLGPNLGITYFCPPSRGEIDISICMSGEMSISARLGGRKSVLPQNGTIR